MVKESKVGIEGSEIPAETATARRLSNLGLEDVPTENGPHQGLTCYGMLKGCDAMMEEASANEWQAARLIPS